MQLERPYVPFAFIAQTVQPLLRLRKQRRQRTGCSPRLESLVPCAGVHILVSTCDIGVFCFLLAPWPTVSRDIKPHQLLSVQAPQCLCAHTCFLSTGKRNSPPAFCIRFLPSFKSLLTFLPSSFLLQYLDGSE
eukprot:5756532-Pleurochrysis_carterae.AAC.2